MIQGLVLVVLGVVLVAWVISPIESLAWWQRSGAREMDVARGELAEALASPAPVGRERRTFVLYLSGVAAFDDDQTARAEQKVLDRVVEALPEITLIQSIYPYAVDNRGLVADRFSGPFWRWFARRRQSKVMRALFEVVVDVRNIYQVLVSADARYGPVYSAGLAQTLWHQLRDHGYVAGSDDEVVLLGWSGGAQIGAGAAWYLGQAGVRVNLLSLGGIFTSDPGLERCRKIVHLTGSRDWQARQMAPMVFPGRRSWVKHSAWNRARAEGRLREVVIGPFRHVGKGSYLSATRGPDGRSYSIITSQAVVQVLREEGWARGVEPEEI